MDGYPDTLLGQLGRNIGASAGLRVPTGPAVAASRPATTWPSRSRRDEFRPSATMIAISDESLSKSILRRHGTFLHYKHA
jgi:hypothetical protein